MTDPALQLCADLAARSARQAWPLDATAYPADWAQPVDSINRLLADMAQQLDAHQRFIAEAAHELRTPLAAIQLYADIATAENDPQTCQQALRHLQEAVARSTRLCQQLLDHSRLQVLLGEKRPCAAIDLSALAREAVIAHEALAFRRHIDLGLQAPASMPLCGDAAALSTLLNNLLNNALQHAPEQSAVDVRIESLPGRTRLSVVDHGPGIAESEWPQVFRLFWRASGKNGGHGLGLTIVQHIVSLHRGQIDLAHTPGGGLTVRVELPQQTFSEAAIS